MGNPILDPLTPEQREAVTHVEGPLLVLAGPGSGKTRVITHRIAYLIQQGIADHQIIGLTFTNKAADEMAQRLDRLVPGHRVWLGTFHKFCVRLLRRYGDRAGIDPNFVIYDTKDRQELIRSVIEELQIDRSSLPPRTVEAVISRAKNEYILPAQFARQASSMVDELIARVYERYEERKAEQHALDFDDLLLVAAELLKQDEELRATLDHYLRFILVDEYQDTNDVQYRIVRLLAKDEPNLCVTGDPDQSIYGWRGANIENILRFEKDYPDCRVVRLETNFRSTEPILRAADRLIRQNRRRKRKALRPVKQGGQPVRIRSYWNERAEAESIALEIEEAVESGRRQYKDFAIFCRMSALTRTLEQALRAHDVPYQILSGVAFYERMEIKDVLAYLRLIVNPRDAVSFVRAVKAPPRGVGDATLARLLQWASENDVPVVRAAEKAEQVPGIRAAQRNALQRFAKMIRQWQELSQQVPLSELIRSVIDKSGYAKWVITQPEGEERLANIEELVTAAEDFEKEEPEGGLAEFLATSTLATDLDRWDEDRGAVSLMTLHAAKGLEFPVVYIVAVEKGILPHSRAEESPEELEEERRLLFVGITRAQEELYISYARERAFRGQTMRTIPSPFLEELGIPVEDGSGGELAAAPSSAPRKGNRRDPLELLRSSPPSQFRPGAVVWHPRYGTGFVLEKEQRGSSYQVVIVFKDGKPKKFLLDKAPLRVLR